MLSPGSRILVIGHDHVAGLGHLGTALTRRGHVWDMVTVVPESRFADPDVTFGIDDPQGWDAVVTLGAPWPRDRIGRWWPDEVEFLRAAHAAGVPVLGICFGGQLLAEALGGSTVRSTTEQVGWFEVESSHDELASGPWFHWNRDQLVAPPAATVLGRTPAGCAAFVLDGAVGLQFHPEMTLPLLRRWLSVPGSVDDESSRALLRATEAIDDDRLTQRVDALVERLLAWLGRG